MNKNLNQLNLEDILTADPFNTKLTIKDANNAEIPYIKNNKEFFKKMYVEPQRLLCVNFDMESITLSFNDFIDLLRTTDNSKLVLLEGYAGCGKSTFAQYTLCKLIDSHNYDHCYYNYDIGATGSNIRGRIKYKIIQMLVKSLSDSLQRKEIRNFLSKILYSKACAYIDPAGRIKKMMINDAFDEMVESLLSECGKNRFCNTFEVALQELEIAEILGLDAILRISLYLSKQHLNNRIYMCYDNLDTIDDVGELSDFDRVLRSFCILIDKFISTLFEELSIIEDKPLFMCFVTYRKVTAAKIESISPLETEDDRSEFWEKAIQIDLSDVFLYTEIVSKRKTFYKNFITKHSFLQPTNNRVAENLKLVQTLLKKQFFREKYSLLWNNNYRICNKVLNNIVQNYHDQVCECANKKSDGFVIDSYYGASSIFLSLVCKTFNRYGIWGKNGFDLIDLTHAVSYSINDADKTTSLTRLILTYMKNKIIYEYASSVSIQELYDEFGDIFSKEKLCQAIVNMLTRYSSGVWRRPIYYYKNALNSTDLLMNIKRQLDLCEQKQCYNYVEFEISESGIAFIDVVMCEYEFFLNRLSNENLSLFAQSDPQKVLSKLEEVLNAVENCCKNLSKFRDLYIKVKKIKLQDFIERKIHPKTTTNCHFQLHEERVIFSHIAYLNELRMGIIKSNYDKNNKQSLNKKIAYTINLYLDLYFQYVLPVDGQREELAKKLRDKCKLVLERRNEVISIDSK